MSNVVGLHGAIVPTGGVPNPQVVEQVEKLLALAMSGEIVGIQAVVIHGDAAASLIRAGAVSFSLVGMLHCAAHEAITALQAVE